MLIGGVTTVVMNANPLIPLDGYFALSDWLEVPNLRQRAFAHLGLAGQGARCSGWTYPQPPADEREQRIFLIYGAAGGVVHRVDHAASSPGTVYGWLDRALGAAGGVALRRWASG